MLLSKRIVLILLSIVVLLFAGCQAANDSRSPKDSNSKFQPNGQKVESAIFGRSIDFNSYVPHKDIVLPIETKKIIDLVQINMNLYILGDGAVFSLNTETGDNLKLFDTSSKMLTSHEEALCTVDTDSKAILTYSEKGELLDTKTISVEEDVEIIGIIVTNDYYVLKCKAVVSGIYTLQFNVFDRLTGSKVNSFNVKNPYSFSEVNIFACSYKDNCILIAKEDTTFNWYDLYSVDVETGKQVEVAELTEITKTSNFDIVYNSKTDTVIALVGRNSNHSYYNYGDLSPNETPLTISEYSLSDPDNILHQKFYLDNPADAGLFVSVHENIISAICTCDNEYRYFDYTNPPESITLAYNAVSGLSKVIGGFEKETGIIVRTVNLGSDYQRLDIKLMAGDTDFDLFEPVGMHQHKYFTSGMFEDLSQYEGLKQRFEGCPAASFVSSLNGEYVGLPTYISNNFTKEAYPENETVPILTYSIMITKQLYYAQNIDIANKIYKDADGEELYKVLKYLYENPNGNEEKMPLGKELKALDATFILMNRSSLKKDSAVKFLEYVFDAFNGNVEGIVDDIYQYPNIDSIDEYYVEWNFNPWAVVEPIGKLCNSIYQTDGKSSTLKKLAREAAAEVAMRIAE